MKLPSYSTKESYDLKMPIRFEDKQAYREKRNGELN